MVPLTPHNALVSGTVSPNQGLLTSFQRQLGRCTGIRVLAKFAYISLNPLKILLPETKGENESGQTDL